MQGLRFLWYPQGKPAIRHGQDSEEGENIQLLASEVLSSVSSGQSLMYFFKS